MPSATKSRGRKPIQPCKGVSTKKPNRCRRRTACKIAARPSGSSNTYCRKKHNKKPLAALKGGRTRKNGGKRGGRK